MNCIEKLCSCYNCFGLVYAYTAFGSFDWFRADNWSTSANYIGRCLCNAIFAAFYVGLCLEGICNCKRFLRCSTGRSPEMLLYM